MNTIKGLILLIVILVFVEFSNAQIIENRQYSIDYLTTDNGLPQNTIDCILKDNRGFMWFGTWNGLARFDGYNFVNYQKDKSLSGLTSNFVYTLNEDGDGNIWIGTRKGLSIFNYRMNSFVSSDTIVQIFGNYTINKIVSDQMHIWIGTENHGLWKVENFNTDSLFIENIPLIDRHINDLIINTNKQLLIGTDNGLHYIDTNSEENSPKLERLKLLCENINVHSLYEDVEKNTWIGTESYGLYLYRSENLEMDYIGAESSNPIDLSHLSVRSITEDANGTLMVGTLGGLNYYDKKNNSFYQLSGRSENNKNLNNPFVNSIFADTLGNVWVGTEKGGVNYYNAYQKPFKSLRHDILTPLSLSHNTINSVFVDNSILWIGTAGGGLNKVNRTTNDISYFRYNPKDANGLSNDFVTSILKDEQSRLWVSTWGGGLNQVQSVTQKTFTVYNNNPADDKSITSDFISSITQLNENALLIGTLGGLEICDLKNQQFIHVDKNIKEESVLEVGCILLDRSNRCWVGTRNGLYQFDTYQLQSLIEQKNQLNYQKLTTQTNDSLSLPGDYIVSMLETKQGDIWFGTYGNGICKLVVDGEKYKFISYTETDGLCNNVAYAMQEDQEENIWISTDKGLSKFNPDTEEFKNFFVKDGLLSDQFYWTASAKATDGQLYFGGVNGLNYFDPDKIEMYQYPSKPALTKLSIFNNEVKIGEQFHKKTILEKSISETEAIELSYRDAVFSVEFSALNFFLPEKIDYAYKMEGFDQGWVTVSSDRRFANYTNLSGGKYTFRVKASNSDGIWSEDETQLSITIIPPFYQTIAFQITLLLFVIISVMFYIQYRIRLLTSQKRKLESQVIERTKKIEEQKEELANQNHKIISQRDEVIELNKKVNLVNQLRLRFFTNISHEFRTPLTLIIDPLENLLANYKGDKETKNTIKLINRNAQRLLHLINQLLYFRKIESGKLKLNVSQGDFVPFLKEIFESFNDLANKQKIDYNFTVQGNCSETWFDAEKLENVFYNLISNAFKFTPVNGSISLSITFREPSTSASESVSKVRVSVADTGKGITKESLPFIFDRYFQESPNKKDDEMSSSGIGLALCNEIVKALQGELTVESELNKGSKFSVELPYSKSSFSEDDINADAAVMSVNLEGRVDVLSEYISVREENFENPIDEDKSKPLLLIVEDNFDLRNFLIQTMRPNYRTIGAEDGKVAFELAKKYSPELIISDVMMPVMDGIELCSRLKTEIQTSHIPVILLTAKNRIENWVEGLETGADDYIAKPFNLQILQVKMNNLIDSRRKLKLMFSAAEHVSAKTATANSLDEEFINRAYTIISKKYLDSEFSVDHFAKEMLVSRSLLYKKIKAITDLSITDFINSYKLKKALELLKTSNNSISEVAYSVGFNDPKYFSRIFKKFYGMKPSDLNK